MKKLPIALTLATALATSSALADDDHRYGKMKTYHVTITNTTAHHIITPPAVIAHKKGFRIFHVAQPASDELAVMAETGNNAPLLDSLAGNPYVYSTASSLDQDPPVVLPGESLTIEIEAPRRSHFTVAGMLATTNDAFTAITLKGPKRNRTTHGMAMTYDSGSEKNTELCVDIPGPPCNDDDGAGTNYNERVTDGAEGFVTIHNGVHGVGDLVPADLDWRGPTAIVRIHNDG